MSVGQWSPEDLECLVEQTRKDFDAQAGHWSMLDSRQRTVLFAAAVLVALGLCMQALDHLRLLDAGGTVASMTLAAAGCLVFAGCTILLALAVRRYPGRFHRPPALASYTDPGAQADTLLQWLALGAAMYQANERVYNWRTRATVVGGGVVLWQAACLAQYASYRVPLGAQRPLDATGMLLVEGVTILLVTGAIVTTCRQSSRTSADSNG